MKVAVFLGPTLPVSEASQILEATYLPPVAQGDVFRVARQSPKVIAIVDGYFERVPAIWHKEILFAMAEGIHVFGASSMGALRAAELAEFGMEGVGKIYRDFASGVLDADDEVAVAHASEGDDYRMASEAMVNIRATLAEAHVRQLVSAETHTTLVALAKQTFYAERSFVGLTVKALEEGLPRDEIDALRTFLATNRIDQKRLDAVELLQVVRARLDVELPAKQVAYSFEHTDAWQYMCAHGRDDDA